MTDITGSTTMTTYAHNVGIPVEKIAFSVEKEMSANPRRIGRLIVRYEITTDCDEKSFKKLINAGKTCPLRHSIHPDIVLDETYERLSPNGDK